MVNEGIAGLLADAGLDAIGHDGVHFAGGVDERGESVAGRGIPQVLGEVRPAVACIVLAAAVVVRVHRKHRAAILHCGRFVAMVALRLVRGGEVAQRFHIGGESCWKRVEGGVFAAFGPRRVAGDGGENAVGEHFFGDATGFNGLARAVLALAGVFIGAEHAAGHLAVELADFAPGPLAAVALG